MNTTTTNEPDDSPFVPLSANGPCPICGLAQCSPECVAQTEALMQYIKNRPRPGPGLYDLLMRMEDEDKT